MNYFFLFKCSNVRISIGLWANVPKCADKHRSEMRTAHASGFMDRDGNEKYRKRGDFKIQQLSWVANMTRIMPLAARQ